MLGTNKSIQNKEVCDMCVCVCVCVCVRFSNSFYFQAMYHYVALLQAGFTSCGCRNSEMFVQLNWQAVTSAASPCVDQKWSSLA